MTDEPTRKIIPDEPTVKITKDEETLLMTPGQGSRAGLPDDTPSTVDHYRLINLIGKGGMGEVYAAEQTEPIQRKVALKIIKLGMDSREFIQRFESERQALAMMDHHCIAKVFDAGTSEQGRPYIVMEYVDGIPIRQFCNEHKLGINARLKLFIEVCRGVQHAHQKAIIHRDIKSSNVLVTKADGEFRPKIIDFGLAKAVGEEHIGHSVQTQMGAILGTLEYMSPEQVDFSGDQVDTRTDIYLLGVLLYVMLTDLLPFDSEKMHKAGLDKVLDMIRNIDPPRPSVRVREAGDQAEAIAALRGLTPAKLISTLSGDLDWITMMALEKDKNLRYETANALAVDIENYLNDLPTVATPPSRAYRVRKFVRRNRVGVIGATFVFAAIVLGIVGTTIGMVRAKIAQQEAKTEAETAHQVSDFMVGLFEVSDPSEARGNTITAREILDRGVEKIEVDLANQPETQARLLNTMGRVYKELGLYTEARPLLQKSLSTFYLLDAGRDYDASVVMDDLGGLLRVSGDFDEARELLEKSLAIREEEFGPNHPEVAQGLNSYANLLWQIGETDLARENYLRALAIREDTLGPTHPDVAITLNNLGGLAMQAWELEDAELYFQRALDIRQKSLGMDHPDVARSLVNLGKLHWMNSDFDLARPYLEEALAIREKVFGPGHPMIADSLIDYANLLHDAGYWDEALANYERALEIRIAALGPDHPDVAGAMNNVALALMETGEYERSRVLLEEALVITETALGPDHIKVVVPLNNLALIEFREGDVTGALVMFERALAIEEKNFGPDHPKVAESAGNVGDALLREGDIEGAKTYYLRSLAILEASLDPDHPEIALALSRIGNLHTNAFELEEAGPYLERALAIRQKTLGPEHLETGRSLVSMGLLSYYRGEIDVALPYFEEADKILEGQLDPSHPEMIDLHYNMACLYALQGKKEQAVAHLQQSVDGGFANPYITQDGDLALLHGDPRYEKMVTEVQNRAGE